MQTDTIQGKIIHKIKSKGRGWCFTPSHFTEYGSNDSIRKALSNLVKAGQIKRLTFGLYEYPRFHKDLGELPPNIERVIQAITERDKVSYQPSGAYAANLLGISEQVPAKIVVLTAGSTKTIQINKTQILFKKTTPKNMLAAGTISGLVIQAFKFIGKDNISSKIINSVKRKLSSKDLEQLRSDLNLPPVWIAKIIKKDFLGE